MKSDELLAWVDIETTGLDPRNDSLLEIACIVTDRELNYIDEFQIVAWFPDSQVSEENDIHPVVLEMHDKSGLWREANEAPNSETVCYEKFGEFLQAVLDATPGFRKFVMGGSGVARFDFTWFQLNCPNLINHFFSYYTLDIGVVRRALELANAFERNDDESPRDALEHRAMSDVKDHLAEWSFYLSILMNRFPQPVPDWKPNA